MFGQKKWTKEKAAPVAAPAQNQRGCSVLLANAEREPNSPAAKTSPLGLEHRLANSLGVGSGARLALRGLEQQPYLQLHRCCRVI
ncbi:MAG: hypothetical protein A2W18_08550 [Candidatus Muproteobacteria bacterium RBG_16_60_9]|uniref:Uncharacterized protein n=1 Tax=Candidatus Muproteobacteria bacterium RBG_16_60_9 TaxID=1817755 RepID=A0A1F6VH06_9PROT|nr:MAG: hypothetical protein A2W18_08550 [Candidatus Muproteobacteria bacterium RBG_16_60_9]